MINKALLSVLLKIAKTGDKVRTRKCAIEVTNVTSNGIEYIISSKEGKLNRTLNVRSGFVSIRGDETPPTYDEWVALDFLRVHCSYRRAGIDMEFEYLDSILPYGNYGVLVEEDFNEEGMVDIPGIKNKFSIKDDENLFVAYVPDQWDTPMVVHGVKVELLNEGGTFNKTGSDGMMETIRLLPYPGAVIGKSGYPVDVKDLGIDLSPYIPPFNIEKGVDGVERLRFNDLISAHATRARWALNLQQENRSIDLLSALFNVFKLYPLGCNLESFIKNVRGGIRSKTNPTAPVIVSEVEGTILRNPSKESLKQFLQGKEKLVFGAFHNGRKVFEAVGSDLLRNGVDQSYVLVEKGTYASPKSLGVKTHYTPPEKLEGVTGLPNQLRQPVWISKIRKGEYFTFSFDNVYKAEGDTLRLLHNGIDRNNSLGHQIYYLVHSFNVLEYLNKISEALIQFGWTHVQVVASIENVQGVRPTLVDEHDNVVSPGEYLMSAGGYTIDDSSSELETYEEDVENFSDCLESEIDASED